MKWKGATYTFDWILIDGKTIPTGCFRTTIRCKRATVFVTTELSYLCLLIRSWSYCYWSINNLCIFSFRLRVDFWGSDWCNIRCYYYRSKMGHENIHYFCVTVWLCIFVVEGDLLPYIGRVLTVYEMRVLLFLYVLTIFVAKIAVRTHEYLMSTDYCKSIHV